MGFEPALTRAGWTERDSKMGVWAIPASSGAMVVYLDTPGPGILLQALPSQLAVTPGRQRLYLDAASQHQLVCRRRFS